MADFDATYWDERYAESATVWGAAPNRWVEREVTDLTPGRALDLGCGEGRNAIWLARRGWLVTAVDFSAVAVDKGRAAAPDAFIDWVVADATTYAAPEAVDLALICYLQLPTVQRRAAVKAAAAMLAPDGVLLVIGHDSRNLTDGVGGPQDADVLFTAEDIRIDLLGRGLDIERGGEELRDVAGNDRPAIDAVVRARRPGR